MRLKLYGGLDMNINLSHNINCNKNSWGLSSFSNPEMLPKAYKSTSASFCQVLRVIQSPIDFESSGHALDSDGEKALFFSEKAIDKKKNEVLSTTPVDHLKATLGINISEIADILQITRQAIYDWKSGKAIPSTKNQERINKLIAICKKWESENLGPIRHLIRQNIWNDYSLFDLLCKEDLEEKHIYTYFDKIKIYISALNKEREQAKKIKEQYGFKQLSDREKLEKLKKNSRKIG